MLPKIISVCGQTASGKSSLALQLAKRLNGEIICMDSMQIYRHMDIGTAKPSAEERAIIPHHMLDILEPDATYAVADYRRDASTVLKQVISHGKIPILTGGTGLYLRALAEGLHLGEAKGDPSLREELHRIGDAPGGAAILHERLEKCDAVSAAKLHRNDLRRVIRAIEVFETTGIPLSKQHNDPEESEFDILPIAIDMPREMLYSRIEQRALQMIQSGLAAEVRSLLECGISPHCQSMQGIGYKELVPAIYGEISLEQAIQDLILHTRHYAKRQGTWFRGDPTVCHISYENAEKDALKIIIPFLNADNFQKTKGESI